MVKVPTGTLLGKYCNFYPMLVEAYFSSPLIATCGHIKTSALQKDQDKTFYRL